MLKTKQTLNPNPIPTSPSGKYIFPLSLKHTNFNNTSDGNYKKITTILKIQLFPLKVVLGNKPHSDNPLVIRRQSSFKTTNSPMRLYYKAIAMAPLVI